ncbi:MAG: LysM peptidoglycan-binding domain-containing protein [Arcobacter sp.]|nr:LysM peptidoglycan-binding domain-containing protein [Arcobacter sp.]
MYARTINVEIGKKVRTVLKLLDKNKEELAVKDYKEEVEKDTGNKIGKVESKFITEELAKELGVEPQNVRYISAWIDADDDGEITREYEEEVILEIIPEEITELYFSYNQPSKPYIHKVKKGENLSTIAKQYDTTYQEITSLNRISNPNLIFPEQSLIIPKENKEETNSIKLNGTFIPLGTQINVIAHGTRGSKAKIELLANNMNFEFLKDEQGVTQFDITFDENGQSITPVTLRPKDITSYKSFIDKFTPRIGNSIKEEKLTLKGEIKKENYQSSLETDDMNTIGLLHYQTYVQNAYITNPKTGQVISKLITKQDGNDIIFLDEENQAVARTSIDNIANTFGNINNGLGGLAAGMKEVDGSFALNTSKGVNLKHYESGWAGNHYVKTYSMSKWSSRISKGTFVLSVVIGYVQIDSAHEKDKSYLKEKGIKTPTFIDGIGQRTERQVASTALGFAGGAVAGKLAVVALVALPFSAGVLLTLGTYIVVGGVVGWALSEIGSEAVEQVQELKRSTIINNYSLEENR